MPTENLQIKRVNGRKRKLLRWLNHGSICLCSIYLRIVASLDLKFWKGRKCAAAYTSWPMQYSIFSMLNNHTEQNLQQYNILHANIRSLDSSRADFLIKGHQKTQGKPYQVETGKTINVFIPFLRDGNTEFFRGNQSPEKTHHLRTGKGQVPRVKWQTRFNPLGSFWMDLAFRNIYFIQTHDLITVS